MLNWCMLRVHAHEHTWVFGCGYFTTNVWTLYFFLISCKINFKYMSYLNIAAYRLIVYTAMVLRAHQRWYCKMPTHVHGPVDVDMRE